MATLAFKTKGKQILGTGGANKSSSNSSPCWSALQAHITKAFEVQTLLSNVAMKTEYCIEYFNTLMVVNKSLLGLVQKPKSMKSYYHCKIL